MLEQIQVYNCIEKERGNNAFIILLLMIMLVGLAVITHELWQENKELKDKLRYLS